MGNGQARGRVPMSDAIVFRNNMAVVGWVFMAIWLGGVGLISWLFVRDGGFHQMHPLIEVGIMLMFWMFGLAGGGYLFSRTRVRLTIRQGTATLRESALWKSREERIPAGSITVAPVLKGRDSEGDPYFSCLVVTPDGRQVTVGESHDEASMEALRERVASALRGAS